MLITIAPTETLVEVQNGEQTGTVPARIWRGVTDRGVSVELLITRVAVSKDYPPEIHDEFKRELREEAAPLQSLAFDMRVVL